MTIIAFSWEIYQLQYVASKGLSLFIKQEGQHVSAILFCESVILNWWDKL